MYIPFRLNLLLLILRITIMEHLFHCFAFTIRYLLENFILIYTKIKRLVLWRHIIRSQGSGIFTALKHDRVPDATIKSESAFGRRIKDILLGEDFLLVLFLHVLWNICCFYAYILLIRIFLNVIFINFERSQEIGFIYILYRFIDFSNSVCLNALNWNVLLYLFLV